VRKKKPESAQGQGEGQNEAQQGGQPGADYRDLNRRYGDGLATSKHATPTLFEPRSFVGDGRAVSAQADKRPGSDDAKADHLRWPNAYFRKKGLFTFYTALEQLRHPDEETNNWRAVCGRTATYGSEGGEAKSLPYPYPSFLFEGRTSMTRI